MWRTHYQNKWINFCRRLHFDDLVRDKAHIKFNNTNLWQKNETESLLGLFVAFAKRMFSIFYFLATLLLSSLPLFLASRRIRKLSPLISRSTVWRVLYMRSIAWVGTWSISGRKLSWKSWKDYLETGWYHGFRGGEGLFEGTGLTCSSKGMVRLSWGRNRKQTMLDCFRSGCWREKGISIRSDGTYPGNHSRGSHGWRGSFPRLPQDRRMRWDSRLLVISRKLSRLWEKRLNVHLNPTAENIEEVTVVKRLENRRKRVVVSAIRRPWTLEVCAIFQ